MSTSENNSKHRNEYVVTKVLKDLNADEAAIQDNVVLESQFIRREFRPFSLVTNYLKFKDQKYKGDPRRRAAFWALGLYLISTRGITAVILPIVGIIGLLVANRANGLLKEQNEKVVEQTALAQINRLHSTASLIDKVLDDLGKEIEKDTVFQYIIRTQPGKDTLKPLPRHLTERIASLSRFLRPLNGGNPSSQYLNELRQERGSFFRALLQISKNSQIDIHEALVLGNLSFVDLRSDQTTVLTSFKGNPQANNFRKLIANSSDLSNTNFSYAQLAECQLNHSSIRRATFYAVNFRKASINHSFLTNSIFDNSSFNQAYLQQTNFDEASAKFCDFSRAVLYQASFKNAFLKGADFSRSNLLGANFGNAVLPSADKFKYAVFGNQTNIVGAFVPSRTWINELKKTTLTIEGFQWEAYTTREVTQAEQKELENRYLLPSQKPIYKVVYLDEKNPNKFGNLTTIQ